MSGARRRRGANDRGGARRRPSLLERLTRLDRRAVPGLVRRPELVFFMIAVVALGAGLARLSMATADPAPGERARDQVVSPEGPQDDGPIRVGPTRGVDLDEYVAVRVDTLATLATAEPAARTVAIVSFVDYLEPHAVEGLFAERPLDVLGARYHLAGGAAETTADALERGRFAVSGALDTALVSGLRDAAAEADDAAAELATIIETTDDEEFVEVYAADRDRLQAAADRVGAQGCACLYAVEVTGNLADLHDLAADGLVRLVDIAPPGTGERTVTLDAILPHASGTFVPGS